MKSACCGAERVFIKHFFRCSKCQCPCDVAPPLRDSKEVLEFVDKKYKQLSDEFNGVELIPRKSEHIAKMNFLLEISNFIKAK